MHWKELWRLRLKNAKLRLEFARAYVLEIQKEVKPGFISNPGGGFAYQQALLAEGNASAEFRRVLQVFRDLTVAGNIPDESPYRKRA